VNVLRSGHKMSLSQKEWSAVSIHNVVLAWLRAERPTVMAMAAQRLPEQLWTSGLAALLDQADLNDAEGNRARLRLLSMYRNVFMVEIPPDTEWYEVRSLTDDELQELHVVNYQTFNDPADKNELMKVAARKASVEQKINGKIELRSSPANWEPPILWGHSRDGPFTIIEGNKRLIAYAASGESGINIPVLIGLSRMRCCWHILDDATFLMQDLIRH
jgi:hypothetical protein